MPYLLEVSGSVSSSVDISTVSSGSVVLSYDVPGRIDADYDEWFARYNESGSLGLNSAAESGSFSTSIVESTTEISSSYFVLELENSKTIEVPHKYCHLYYYKTSDNKWQWVGNNSGAVIFAGDYLFGSDGNPVKITAITHHYDTIKSFVIIDVEEIDNAFYGNSSDDYGILRHNKNGGNGGGGSTNAVPTNISCSTVSSTKIRVDWDAASPEDSSAKYDVRFSSNSNMSSAITITGAANTTGAADYSYTVLSLTENTQYYFQVRQGAGTLTTASAWRDTTPDSCTTPYGTPAAPSTPTVSAKGTTTVTFSWSNPGGATSYNVYFGTNNPPTNIVNGTSTTYSYASYTGLSVATTYHFRVTATNSSGTSGYSSTQSTTTSTLAGGQPTLSSVTQVSQTVTWTNPTGTYYSILYGGTSANPTTILTTGTGLSTYNHTGLNPSQTYYYRTRTQTYYHDGYYSDYSSDQSGATSQTAAPTDLISTANSTEQFTFTWTNPTYQTATYVEFFHVGAWRTVNPDSGQSLGDNVATWVCTSADTFDYGGTPSIPVSQNNSHLFRFRAYYSGVYSAYNSITAYTLPGPPTNVAATAISDELITVSWSNPAGSAYSETFVIEYGTTTSYGSSVVTGTNISSHPFTGLQPSQIYYFRVKTRTALGDSTTETANATTAAGPDPVFGDVLSLGALGQATGNANATTLSSLNSASGGTSEVAMRDFFCGGANSTLSGPGSVSMLGGQEELSMTFFDVGSKFISKIADRADQFTWTSSAPSVVSVESTPDYRCTIFGVGNYGQSAVITCVWDANYNGSHDSISSNRTATKTVTVSFEF